MSDETLRPSWHTNFFAVPPRHTDDNGTQHWVTRGANFVLVVSKVKEGTVLERQNTSDEYFVLLPQDVAARFEAGSEAEDAEADTLAIMPPGAGRVIAKNEGYIYRIFTNRNTDLLELADNQHLYADGAPQVAPLVDWPEPVDGYHLRVYHLPKYIREGVFGRLFRTRCLMINPFAVAQRPRPKLSPHAHDDYEQGSLIIQGKFTHHIRYPWGTDVTQWREDEHIQVGSPSLIVIPPPSIHTSQSMPGEAPYQICDIFSPPRVDFSSKPGQVNNDDIYPLPPEVKAALEKAA